MSYSNGTTHYNLPQTIGTDKRDWSDTNKAFADLDAAVYSANNDLTAVADRVTALESDNTINKEGIANNSNSITTIEGRVTAVEHVANDANNGLSDVRSDAEDMITAYNEKTAQSVHDYEVGQFFIYNDVLYRATQNISAGNTIIPNTNCEATNVTSAFGKHILAVSGTEETLAKSIIDAVNTAYGKGKDNLLNLHYISANMTAAIKLSEVTITSNKIAQCFFSSGVNSYALSESPLQFRVINMYVNSNNCRMQGYEFTYKTNDSGTYELGGVNTRDFAGYTAKDGYIVY